MSFLPPYRRPDAPTLAVAVGATLIAFLILFPDKPVRASQEESHAFDLGAMLDRYAGGQFGSDVTALAVAPDVTRFADQFPTGASAWIEGAPAQGDRRRLIAASFLVEAVAVREGRDARTWSMFARDLEWACTQLRQNPVATPGEEIWNRAVAALAIRARDVGWLVSVTGPGRTLVSHLVHAQARFPANPYLKFDWALASAIQIDKGLATVVPGLERKLPPAAATEARHEAATAAIALFAPLVSDPVVGGDAEVRIADLNYEMHSDAEALARAEQAAHMAPGTDVAYQANVIAGLALERLHRPAEAMAAYSVALIARPGGQSATLALAALLTVNSQGERADDLVAQSLVLSPHGDDPWRLFAYGDYMRWDAIVSDLHRALR